MPRVVFDGANDFMELPTMDYSSWTIFIVGRMSSSQTNMAMAFADYGPVPSGGSAFPFLGIYGSSGVFTPYHRDGEKRLIRADDTNGWSRFAIRSAWGAQSTMNYRVNDGANEYVGAGAATAGFTLTTFQGYHMPMIGALPPNGDFNANLELSEFLLYDHTLGASERLEVENYLKAKYFP
jgi:hypothetical protein